MFDLKRIFSVSHVVSEDMEEDLIEKNEEIAHGIKHELEKHNVKSVNIMGSTGSGKTSLIEKTIDELKEDHEIAVVSGDIKADLDANRIKEKGIKAVPMNTGKECHLDGHLVEHALEHIDLEKTDLVIIENVGNLICPVDFNLGENKRVVMVSTTEGDDVVEKHPMIFHTSDLAIVNKSDIAEDVGSDIGKMLDDMKEEGCEKAVSMSVKEEKNLEKWFSFLKELMN